MEFDLSDLARPLPDERARVEAVAFDGTGRWLGAVAFGVFVVYDLRDGTRHAEVALPAGRGVRAVDFTPDGRRAVVVFTHDPRPEGEAAFAVVDLAASSVAALLPRASQHAAMGPVTRLRESLSAWAITPSGESVATAWGRAGVVAFALDGSVCEPSPPPDTTDDTPAEIVGLTHARAGVVALSSAGLAVRADGAWRCFSREPVGRGLLTALEDGERVLAAGHAPRRLGQVARSGAWVLRVADGSYHFDGVKAEGMTPVGASHQGSRVWWARRVERFATRLTPLAVHCHDVAAGTFAPRVTDGRKATSTCVAIDRAGGRAAFGRLRSLGVTELAP